MKADLECVAQVVFLSIVRRRLWLLFNFLDLAGLVP
jgi:hypothetical protein